MSLFNLWLIPTKPSRTLLQLSIPTSVTTSTHDLSYASAHVEEAMGAAAHRLTERFKTGRSVGVPMETRGVVADFDKGRRQLVGQTTTQRPHLLRTYLSPKC